MRIFVPLFLLALAGCAGSAEFGSSGASSRPAPADAAPAGNTIVLRRVMQVARDLDASVAFYRDALGLTVLERRDLSSADLARGLGADATARITSVVLGTASGTIDGGELHGAVLTLLKVDDPKLGRMTHPRGGKGALGETVLSFRVPDLAAVEAKLRAAKAPITGVGRGRDGVQQLTVTDPDGTRVLLYAVPHGAEDRQS
jgi:catechol 2,3-dioxygenase-like lactoylglutathione lyase family enzyme